MRDHQIPQTLDEPPLALIFNAHQVTAFIGGSMVGVVLDQLLICAGLGLVAGSVISRYSDRMPRGYLRHLLYYHGLPILSGKRPPHGLDREFRP